MFRQINEHLDVFLFKGYSTQQCLLVMFEKCKFDVDNKKNILGITNRLV